MKIHQTFDEHDNEPEQAILDHGVQVEEVLGPLSLAATLFHLAKYKHDTNTNMTQMQQRNAI